MTYRVLIPFTVKTKQGDLTLNPGQVVTLAEEKAKALLQTGKIQPLDEFTAAFDQAAHRLSKNYKPGVLEHCRKQHPETYTQMLEAENRLNGFWDKDPHGFKDAIKDWEEIHREILRLFKKS